MTVILCSHNIFSQVRNYREIGLNTNYYVLFWSPRTKNQLSLLGSQLFGNARFLKAAYEDAVEKREHSYLLLDSTKKLPMSLRIRTNILPVEAPVVYYVPV